MEQVIKQSNNPAYSLFVPFTRLWAVDTFLQSLNAMYLPKASTEVIFYNDTNDKELQEQLAIWLDIFGPEFNGAKLYQSGNPLPNDFDVADRRRRICEMKEKSKELISDSTYVFGLEDDTIAPPNAFLRLLEHIATDDDVAVASGVEAGRHAVLMVGIWEISPLDDPQKVSTVHYRNWGTQKVDGVGWYCYITYTSLYKAANYRYEAECLGPDVIYSLDQRRSGYDVLVDWTISCEHLLPTERSIPPSDGTQVVTWRKNNGQWGSASVQINREDR